MDAIDQAQLNFNPTTLTILNVVIGLIMFGVALDLKVDDFKRIGRDPRGPLIGMLGQFVMLPFLSWLLVLLIKPQPSIALGMILVAACPGGNFSNFLTAYAKGNAALSVSMTALATLLAIVMTPFNLQFYGSRTPGAEQILTEVALSPVDLLVTIFVILGLPMGLGMLTRAKAPAFAARLHKPMRIFSLTAFFLFIVFALAGNWKFFVQFVGAVAIAVALQNGIGLAGGYGLARASRLSQYDARAVSIEVGIQNSALGLVIVFTFFDGLGGMAVTAAWWGVWHLISGLTVATYWSRRAPGMPVPKEPAAAAA